MKAEILRAKEQADLISRRLKEALDLLESREGSNRLIAACDLVDQATGTSERLTCQLRGLLSSVFNPDHWVPRNTARALEVTGIFCDMTEEGFFHIAIPALPPKKAHGTTSYLATPLSEALKKFRLANGDYRPEAGLKYVICYIFELSGKDWTRRVDIDNWETNFITDLVANYYLPDDNPAYLASSFALGRESEATMLHCYLVPLLRFGGFLMQQLEAGSTTF